MGRCGISWRRHSACCRRGREDRGAGDAARAARRRSDRGRCRAQRSAWQRSGRAASGCSRRRDGTPQRTGGGDRWSPRRWRAAAQDARGAGAASAGSAAPGRRPWQRDALLRGAEVALLGGPLPGSPVVGGRWTRRGAGGAVPRQCPGGRAGPGGAPAFPSTRPAATRRLPAAAAATPRRGAADARAGALVALGGRRRRARQARRRRCSRD